MYDKKLKWICLVLLAVLFGLVPAAVSAQGPNGQPSRWDIFAGYSYLAPKGTVQIPQSDGTYVPYDYDAVNLGGDFSVAYYFNKYVGVQGEYAEHEWGDSSGYPDNIGTHGNDDGFQTFSGGLIFRFPTENFTPFVHALFGGAVINGPFFNQNKLGPDITVGGGMDYNLPWLNQRFALRVFQADYEYMHADFGPQVYPPGGRANINAARLSAGIVIHVGSLAPPPPVTLACSASPESVFPGEPITVTATAGGLNPKDHVIYSWSGSGVTGNGTSATVATADLAPGQYTVQCGVKEGKPGKEGLKPWESATGTARFTVKEFEPPTISCSASPTTIKPGDTATITSVGVSPQNRPLTYTYSATAGTVTGSGTTAEYSSAGAPTGAVGITCNVSDDKGHSASANTNITISAPYVPPPPKTQALCTINFTTDKRRPERVDNEAKACLDQVALDLKQQPDAKAVVVGEADSAEQAKMAKQEAYAAKHKRAKVDMVAAQRAVNTKDYLVTEQGIDASRISVATGTTDGQTVENYLVPAGATFTNDVTGTTPVDETMVKPQERKPLGAKPHHKAAKASQ
jgi:outer membrane protein OmpA-like peptidoglycan-associated protein